LRNVFAFLRSISSTLGFLFVFSVTRPSIAYSNEDLPQNRQDKPSLSLISMHLNGIKVAKSDYFIVLSN